MLAREVLAFVRGNLPPPPLRILEVGAGQGDLARALLTAGYDVLAVDPGGGEPPVAPVALADVAADAGSFDAGVAIVSLHHVHPLEASCRRLAELLAPGATLLVDELDVERFDERAASWWLEQRGRLGHEDVAEPSLMVARLRAEIHPLRRIVDALASSFAFGLPVRGCYLYRWGLDETIRPVEEALVAEGRLPAVGVRFVAHRKEGAPVVGMGAVGS